MTAELATIDARERRLLDALAEAAAPLDPDALVRHVTARAADLRGLLGRNVAQARQVVQLLLEGRLACQPFEEADARG